MGEPVVDLGRGEDWEPLISVSKEIKIDLAHPYTHIPLEEIVFPLFSDSALILISAGFTKGRSNWTSAGILNQRVRVGLIQGGGQDAQTDNGKRIYFNRLQLVRFPLFSKEYELRFRPNRWLIDIQLTAWKYKGIVSDTTENAIISVGKQVVRTDQKVNEIINFLGDGPSPKTPSFNNPFGFL